MVVSPGPSSDKLWGEELLKVVGSKLCPGLAVMADLHPEPILKRLLQDFQHAPSRPAPDQGTSLEIRLKVGEVLMRASRAMGKIPPSLVTGDQLWLTRSADLKRELNPAPLLLQESWLHIWATLWLESSCKEPETQTTASEPAACPTWGSCAGAWTTPWDRWLRRWDASPAWK